jgi:predicted metalloprotease
MRWEDQRRSENVDDQRRVTPTTVAVGGGVGTLVLVVIALFLGVDPRPLLQQAQRANPPARGNPQARGPVDPAQEKLKDFVSAVLGNTEDVWSDQLPKQKNVAYKKPRLELFSGEVRSACGMANAAVGPFYCPGDEMVYLDLTFFQELSDRFQAPGEFAQAYVIAHEVGHHVQDLLGISDQVNAQRARLSKADYNRLSVRLELQADFLAGVWAHHTRDTKIQIEPGDVESALTAAKAIGDDTLQKESQGYVVPDSFTHGTSAQRMKWFRLGLRTGDLRQGDTFQISDEDL